MISTGCQLLPAHYPTRSTVTKQLLIPLFLLTSACSELPYYIQSAQGQWEITQKKQDINSLIATDTYPAEKSPDSKKQLKPVNFSLQSQLAIVQEARQFAIRELQLPETQSFTEYVDLQRDFVVKNLFAAEEFSTELYSWCYPVIGCANYRGYFDEDMLKVYEDSLKQQNYDTYVAKISAYSTLGWFDDPVLNTFITRPDYQLVSLIFHEIAHQQLYIDNDTAFNESFASAVEQAGLERWFQAHTNNGQLQRYHREKQHKKQVNRLIGEIRHDLDNLYRLKIPATEMREKKSARLQYAITQYNQLKKSTSVTTGYDNWFASGLNNAKLGSISSYTVYVDAFLQILKANNDVLPDFYSHVARLGKLTPAKRKICLELWSPAKADTRTVMPEYCLPPVSE